MTVFFYQVGILILVRLSTLRLTSPITRIARPRILLSSMPISSTHPELMRSVPKPRSRQPNLLLLLFQSTLVQHDAVTPSAVPELKRFKVLFLTVIILYQSARSRKHQSPKVFVEALKLPVSSRTITTVQFQQILIPQNPKGYFDSAGTGGTVGWTCDGNIIIIRPFVSTFM